MLDLPIAYSLAWPLGRPRTASPEMTYAFRQQANRQRHTVWQGVHFIVEELRRMGADDVVISSNLRVRLDGLPFSDQHAPSDAGVAVYFKFSGKNTCFACDKWTQVEDNLWALGLTLEAIRGLERWGAASIEATFTGYLALPAPANIDWPSVLQLHHDASADDIHRAYRRLAKTHHPDAGGSHEGWLKIQAAYDAALKACGVA